MRFEALREQLRAISVGRTINDMEKAGEIVTQIVRIGIAEPQWRDRAAEILNYWCEYPFSQQMPELLKLVLQEQERELEAQQQQQQQKTTSVVDRKKALNREIEQLILIAAIEKQKENQQYAAAIALEQVAVVAQQAQERTHKLEMALQARVDQLKGSII